MLRSPLMRGALSLTGLYCTRHDRLVCTGHGRFMWTTQGRPM